MITLTVNGKRRELPEPTPLLDFLAANQIAQSPVAVGHNGTVVHRDRWHEVVLEEGDVVDIVQMVGGG